MSDRPAVSRRPLFDDPTVALSSLAFTVDPGRAAGDPERTVRLLRLARAAGVTTFDVVGVANPRLAETVLARAFPTGDPELVILTEAPGAEGRLHATTAPRPGEGPPSDRNRPGPRAEPPGFRRLYESGSPATPRPGAPLGPSSRAAAPPPNAPTAFRCASLADVDLARGSPPPWLFAGTFSLLEHDHPFAAAERCRGRAFAWIARDVLAGGRLDGSRFAPPLTAFGAATPPSLRELEVDLARLAPLGFLARAGQRTLGQAALRYVVDLPWVATACLPLPDPRRWEEVLGFTGSPPLEPAERERLAVLAGPRGGTP